MPVAIVLRAVIVVIGVLIVIALIGGSLGLIHPWIDAVSPILSVGLVVLAARAQSPISPRSRGVVTVNAPRAEVWERAAFKQTRTHWRPFAPRIDAVPGTPDEFVIHMTAGDEVMAIPVRVADQVEGERFTTLSRPSDGEAGDLGEVEMNAYTFADAANGGTVVTLSVQATQPALHAVALCWIINPAQDTLDHMKAVLDGSPDRSLKGLLARGAADES